MKKLYRHLAVIIIGLVVGPLGVAMADPAPTGVLIVELQTGGIGTGAAAQEFVELHNPLDVPVDVTGWKLQYRAASKLPTDTWPATSTTTISCTAGSSADCHVVIGPGSRITLAASALGLVSALSLNGGFADAGGQIRLVEPSGAVDDFIGYGSALDFETAAAPKPAGGESLKRKVGLNGRYIDTNNNLADFTLGCGAPSPGDDAASLAGMPDGCPIFESPAPPEQESPVTDLPPTETNPPPVADPPAESDPNPIPPSDAQPPTTENQPDVPPQIPVDPTPPVEPQIQNPPSEDPPATEQPTLPTYLPLQITEVLPDPAAPQTDTADEFVELFNPNDQPVELTGYVLKTGLNFERSIVLPAATILPGQYFVVTSGASTLSLVNSGTAIKLVDPLGVTINEAPNYQQAIVGESWVPSDDTWAWTTTVTPGLVNVLTTPVPPVTTPPVEAEENPASDEPAANNNPGITPAVYLPITITELLPDPVSPGQDSTDEFIELFNPNAEAVNVVDYQLQSGSGYRYKFTLPDITIQPGQYVVIASEESGLSLSNAGTQVRLLSPLGEVVDEVANYGKAVEGSSWSKLDGAWQWSTTPTPGQANLMTLLPAKAPKPVTAKGQKAKKTAAPKVKTASTVKTEEPEAVETPDESEGSAPNYWLLAGIGSMAVGYGVYEYRQGIVMGIRKLWSLARGRVPED